MAQYWRPDRIWDGATCVIIAGGPSVTPPAVKSIRTCGHRVIAINDSYQLAPWADVLYFCDARWHDWHKGNSNFSSFNESARRGERLMVTLENGFLCDEHKHIKMLKNVGRLGLSLEPGEINHGSNGGYQAINLAVHLGAKRLLLLGYDMKHNGEKTHWHNGHKVKSPPTVYNSLMIPSYQTIAQPLRDAGVEVINCSEGSALSVFPIMPLDKAIRNEASVAVNS